MVMKSREEKINGSFSENALKMMRKRYLQTKDDGKQETPAEMFKRIAEDLADVEKEYGKDSAFVKKTAKEFFDIMTEKEFTPAGRTITNAGAKTPLVANCIVLDIEDSMEGIFQTLKEAALLQQAGAGLGFALDKLRPSMARTVKSQGVSSGPVSFLKIYNEAFGIIKQQGRHGANMAMIGVDHPDFLDFISAKEIEGSIRNFNISVKLTDDFMKQLLDDPSQQWYCTWKKDWPGEPGKVKPLRVLRHPNGSVYDVEEVDITVGEVFDEIVNYAWNNGEPGVVFIDEVNRTNPLPGLGKILTSNPCGEQFLHAYDVCNLGSINLGKFVKNGKVDYEHLRYVSKTATRLLDNVIDRFDFPVEELTKFAQSNRRVGLGIMGFADMLYQIGIKYNSDDGYKMAEKVMKTIQDAAHEISRELAEEKGVFPNIKKSIYAGKKMRNAAITTVAPTGSISMMFGCSSGLEPNFALAYVKQDKYGEQYHYLNEHFEAELATRNFTKREVDRIKDEVIEKGSIQHMTDLPQDLRDTFVVSMDIPGEDHVRMQAAFQRHVDNSISKTINFPNSATKEDIRNSYIQAWKLGCKSCTVYRDGSRVIQVLNVGKDKVISTTEAPVRADDAGSVNLSVNSIQVSSVEMEITERERPEVLIGKTYRVRTGYGNLFITINSDASGMPFEVFATLGKSGGHFQEQTEAIARLISLALRSHINPRDIIGHLKGIRGPMITMTEKGSILSLPDAIGKILEEHILNRDDEIENAIEEEVAVASSENSIGGLPFMGAVEKPIADYGFMPECPDCGASLVMAEGCVSCKSCGYSRCL